MSVFLFDQEKVNRLLGMLRYHHKAVIQTLQHSPYFTHYLKRIRYNGAKEEKVENEFIGRMIWYALVSNKVAYILQYREAVPFHDIELDYERTEKIPCSAKDIYLELRHLAYNMSTNDGNRFMEKKWYEPFEEVTNDLALSLVSR